MFNSFHQGYALLCAKMYTQSAKSIKPDGKALDH
jgi:hypothetical protein